MSVPTLKEIGKLSAFIVLPILLTATSTVLIQNSGALNTDAAELRATADGAETAIERRDALAQAAAAAAGSEMLRNIAIALVVASAALLIWKGFVDWKWGITSVAVRHRAIRDISNKFVPALRVLGNLALMDPTDTTARRVALEHFVEQCCSGAVMMLPHVEDVRVSVFEVKVGPAGTTVKIAPIGQSGRSDVPRTFDVSNEEGTEVWRYLDDPPPEPEIYEDIRKVAPPGYSGDADRYLSFIRAPIVASGPGIVYGMLCIDAPGAGSLKKEDTKLADFVAGQLHTAFAVLG